MSKLKAYGAGTMQPEKEMLTADEVAEYMNVHVRTVRNWINSGELPYVRIGPRGYRISRTDLLAFINSQKHQKPSNPNEEKEN